MPSITQSADELKREFAELVGSFYLTPVKSGGTGTTTSATSATPITPTSIQKTIELMEENEQIMREVAEAKKRLAATMDRGILGEPKPGSDQPEPCADVEVW